MLVFLNDVTPLSPDWLTVLVAQAQRPGLGVVGAVLLYLYGAVQPAGLTMGFTNGVGRLHRHTFGGRYWNWLRLTRNVAAVTGACRPVPRSVFDSVGRFDCSCPIDYNDAEPCLRVRQADYEVICQPAALLRHAECRTRRAGIRHAERTLWASPWREWLESEDRFYNFNLAHVAEETALSHEYRPQLARFFLATFGS